MTEQLAAAREMIGRCLRLREQGSVEAVLRTELASWLRRVFPDQQDTAWVNHYTEGVETAVRIGRSDGQTRQGFIDNLVRSTVIEYEADLRQEAVWKHGHQQVQDYVAAAVRAGTPVSQILGVLSDTVQWHVFDVELAPGVSAAACQPAHIRLIPREDLNAEAGDAATAERLIAFLRKYLAREQSRPLTAEFITTDLGLESPAYGRHVDALSRLVDDGRRSDTSIALATDLWSRFVDYLEGRNLAFRTPAYVDEAYITILARLLCANVLERQALLSNDAELKSILDGQFFRDHFHLQNMVEHDYFGWMLKRACLATVLPVARDIQGDLYAYDFSRIGEEDLFGRLMTQLARRSLRKLLGQECTPQWIAKALVEKCLGLLPPDETPRVVDMCCGSGVFLAEVLKAAKVRHAGIGFPELSVAATGFDIDPLAVLLAKTTWVVTLADEVRTATAPVVVPVYHADSLFAVTPITRGLPLPGETKNVVVELDGHRVVLPAEMVGPDCQQLFDEVIDWSYDEALHAQENGVADGVTIERATELVEALVANHGVAVPERLTRRMAKAAHELAHRMAELAVKNRNGIWAFILRNTYRPGLLAGQFNGLVSNPPWLALSQLADNPYRRQLVARAEVYGIKPGGAAHLHVELATTHLLHAIDRYLRPGAAVACLVPGTILNAQHHAKFRDAAYLDADRGVPFELQEVWNIPEDTFNVLAVAAVGAKRGTVADVSRASPRGVMATPTGLQDIQLQVHHLASRIAWVLENGARPHDMAGTGEIPPQGADLMPRPAVCVEILSRDGREWRVRTPQRGDPSFFAVKDAKKLQGMTFPGAVAPEFIHRMAQSLNLLPFTLDGHCVQVAIPARRQTDGAWQVLDAAAIRTAGFQETARRFQRIDRAMRNAGVIKPLAEKVDERHKLSAQLFPPNQFLVVNGAGGGIVCAACYPVTGNEDLIIDQTLYWQITATEDEAWYRVGLMNSDALTVAIRPFVPSGKFGERHLHTLPHRVIPTFDLRNRGHLNIAHLAQCLSQRAQVAIAADANVADPTFSIAGRRKRLRDQLKQLPEFEALDRVCAAVLTRQGPL